jgi:glutaredoxin
VDRFLIQYLKYLAVTTVFFTSMIGSYLLIHHKRIFPSLSTVVVYGRNSCGITQSMRAFLKQNNVSYIYANIDNSFIDKEMWFYLHKVAASDPDPGYAYFPVVRVNGQTLERPEEDTVLNLYKEAKTKLGNDKNN